VPVCHGTSKCGNLYCSVKCAKTAEEKVPMHVNALKGAGFVEDEAAPNKFCPDGVSITLERTFSAGLD
jgi:hypothetical protein